MIDLSLSYGTYTISVGTLNKCSLDNLQRLAQFLKLKKNIDIMSKKQLVQLIHWRITRWNKFIRFG
jgi:hypothetical protein